MRSLRVCNSYALMIFCTSADVVRHPLVQKIFSAYELHTKSERIDAPSDTPPGRR